MGGLKFYHLPPENDCRHPSPAASPQRAAGRDSAGEACLPTVRGMGKGMVATPYSGWAALPMIACVMLCAPFGFLFCFWMKKKRRSAWPSGPPNRRIELSCIDKKSFLLIHVMGGKLFYMFLCRFNKLICLFIPDHNELQTALSEKAFSKILLLQVSSRKREFAVI